MYKLIVKRIVRRTFASLSKGDYEPIVKQFGPQSRFVFAGDHALGGERRGQEAVREWFQEMLRLFPGIQIVPARGGRQRLAVEHRGRDAASRSAPRAGRAARTATRACSCCACAGGGWSRT